MLPAPTNPDENALTGFYRRPLPAGLIPFSSEEGRTIFREALDLGGMERWFPLAEHFHTQSEPAFCALGSLVVVLNALAIDPRRTWKGPWRWYSEEMLDCCDPLEQIRAQGMSLPSFVCLARCNGATALLRRPPEADLERFRADLAGPSHLISSFSRSSLGQTGDGHYSPLGGWHPKRELVLVLDVARFKYPPFWLPLKRLWEAMLPPDPVTQKPRGWVVLNRDPRPRNLHARFACERPGWREAVRSLSPALEAARQEPDPERALLCLAQAFSPELQRLVHLDPPAHQLLLPTRLYRLLEKQAEPGSLSLLILAIPDDLLSLPSIFREDIPVEILREAEALRAQLLALQQA